MKPTRQDFPMHGPPQMWRDLVPPVPENFARSCAKLVIGFMMFLVAFAIVLLAMATAAALMWK